MINFWLAVSTVHTHTHTLYIYRYWIYTIGIYRYIIIYIYIMKNEWMNIHTYISIYLHSIHSTYLGIVYVFLGSLSLSRYRSLSLSRSLSLHQYYLSGCFWEFDMSQVIALGWVTTRHCDCRNPSRGAANGGSELIGDPWSSFFSLPSLLFHLTI